MAWIINSAWNHKNKRRQISSLKNNSRDNPWIFRQEIAFFNFMTPCRKPNIFAFFEISNRDISNGLPTKSSFDIRRHIFRCRIIKIYVQERNNPEIVYSTVCIRKYLLENVKEYFLHIVAHCDFVTEAVWNENMTLQRFLSHNLAVLVTLGW